MDLPSTQAVEVQLIHSALNIGLEYRSLITKMSVSSQSPRPCEELELNRDSKKRKRVSEAEKVATELSKLVCELYKLVPRRSQETHVKFENNRICFPKTKQINIDAEACNLTDHRQRPSYCRCSEFKFEASLPDRDHLTRFSVFHALLIYCPSCS